MRLISVCTFVLLLAALTGTVPADGEGELVLSGSDALCLPGEKVTLSIKVEKDGVWRKDVKGAELSIFRLTGEQRELLAKRVTNGDGWAQFEFHCQRPGLFKLAVDAVEVEDDGDVERGTGEFLVACRGTERIGVVVDIDDTLTPSDGSFFRRSVKPRGADTVKVMSELAERYDLIYLTGRLRWSSTRTRSWLGQQGFPAAPLFLRDLKRSGPVRSGTFKSAFLKKLRRRYPNILIGIGDENGDVDAYTDNGMIAVLMEETEEESWNVKDWAQVRELLLGEDVTFTDGLSGELKLSGEEWRFSCVRGAGGWELSAPGLGPLKGDWRTVRDALLKYLREQAEKP